MQEQKDVYKRQLLDEVVITASKSSNMKSDRAGAVTNVDAARLAVVTSTH